mmetsp:Transcript_5042/g.12721  ORF Transcript_5042/g.12721 Transcript_5042/m.12721 type:complete len:212 (+) Transcript_5042:1698-2333(+)
MPRTRPTTSATLRCFRNSFSSPRGPSSAAPGLFSAGAGTYSRASPTTCLRSPRQFPSGSLQEEFHLDPAAVPVATVAALRRTVLATAAAAKKVEPLRRGTLLYFPCHFLMGARASCCLVPGPCSRPRALVTPWPSGATQLQDHGHWYCSRPTPARLRYYYPRTSSCSGRRPSCGGDSYRRRSACRADVECPRPKGKTSLRWRRRWPKARAE